MNDPRNANPMVREPWMLRSRWRLFGSLFLMLAWPTAALVGLIMVQVRMQYRDDAITQQTMAAHLFAAAVGEEFTGLKKYVESYSTRLRLRSAIEAGDTGEISRQLEKLVTGHGRITRAFMTDSAGTLLADYPPDPAVAGRNFSERDWYRGATTAEGPYVSEVYQRMALGGPYVVAIANRMTGPMGETQAYLVAQVTLSSMTDWLMAVRPTATGTLSLVDQRGRLVAFSGGAGSEHSAEAAPIVLEGQFPTEQWKWGTDPFSREESLLCVAPVESIGWKVMTSQPSSTVQEPIRTLVRSTLVVFAACLGGTWLLGYMWYATMMGYDEARRAALEALSRSRDELEERVAERTAELQETNEALRSSEMRHRAFFELSAVGMVQADPQTGRLWRVNERYCQITGYSSEELLGMDARQLTHPDEREASADAIGRMIRGETPIYQCEKRYVRKDGSIVWVQVEATMIKDEAGQPSLTAAVILDVTERHLAEEAVERSIRELARSNTELEQFAYVASHDLQEPLRKIISFGDRLTLRCKDQMDEQGTDYLVRMQSAAGRMQTLITDILSLSRVTSRARPFTAVDLNVVLEEVTSDLEARIQETGATVRGENLPTIDADDMQMRQLIQNLVGNAIKFRRPGVRPTVVVRGEFVKGSEAGVKTGPGVATFRLEVIDNGIGFEEKYLDRLFTPFQRLHGRGEYEGTGMGLAICRKIAERHGGTITARSMPGQGSTFVVDIPARQPTSPSTSTNTQEGVSHPWSMSESRSQS